MIRSDRNLMLRAFKVADMATVGLSFVLSLLIDLSKNISFSSFVSVDFKVKHFLLAGILILVWHCIFSLAGLYQSKRIGAVAREIADILICTAVGSLIMIVLGCAFGSNLLTRSFVTTFWLSITITMILGRIALRNILSILRVRGINRRFILIVGTGSRAQSFYDVIRRRKDLGYSVVGFIDDNMDGGAQPPALSPVLGCLDELPEIISNIVLDEIVVSLPIKSHYEKMEEIIYHCERLGIIVRVLTDLFTMSSASTKSRVDMLGEIPVLSFYSGPYENLHIAMKRSLDLVFSVFLLAMLSPLFVLAAVAIRLTMGNPVFFVQDRVGHNRRIFKIIKFRTMVENAEALLPSLRHLNETDGPTFKIRDDPRVTRLGKLLRRTSIDELPQLINVLKGEMSLVGPRPLPIQDYNGFSVDWQKKRFSVKPGLTCSWQIEGRSDIGFSRWMEMDMEYIEKWSLWLDLKIILKTISVVMTGKGAA
jgi:exopolysaccharide biosynthesis polyprenyl glycosylphosphotransferase